MMKNTILKILLGMLIAGMLAYLVFVLGWLYQKNDSMINKDINLQAEVTTNMATTAKAPTENKNIKTEGLEKPVFAESKTALEPHAPRKVKRSSNRGIYITEWTAKTPSKFNKLKEKAIKSGIDTMVIDTKDTLGMSLLPLLKQHKLTKELIVTPDAWLSQITDELHALGYIVTARVQVFRDDTLVLARPDLAVKLTNGGNYRDTMGARWTDPYSAEVRLFNQLIAERAAMSGVDEVQFDYIRFPAEGAMHSVTYPAYKPELSKVDVICMFLKDAKQRLASYNVSIAVDIFGVTAWQSQIDVKNLGQDIRAMAQYIDVLSPMLYPSHFNNGYDGHANPGSEPYYFIHAGVSKSHEILASSSVKIVPWIQGFVMKSPNFGPDYIAQQVKASKDGGGSGFLIWNAGNMYDVSFAGLKPKAQ